MAKLGIAIHLRGGAGVTIAANLLLLLLAFVVITMLINVAAGTTIELRSVVK